MHLTDKKIILKRT